MSDTVYFIEPVPDAYFLIELNNAISKRGYKLTYTSKDAIFEQSELRELLIEKGITEILSVEALNEDVLPDNSPKSLLINILKQKLDKYPPQKSLLLIDPYIYPSSPDADYISVFHDVFMDSISTCSEMEVVTLSNRSKATESLIDAEIYRINPSITLTKKYTNTFHDRLWIVDDIKGLFVGASLNGIGRRYAVVDYLNDNDVIDIVNRCSLIT